MDRDVQVAIVLIPSWKGSEAVSLPPLFDTHLVISNDVSCGKNDLNSI